MIEFVISGLSGILVKAVDYIEDKKKKKSKIVYPLAVIYGILIGYVIAVASFGVMFLAALVAQVLARKLDTMSHRIGFLSAIITAVYFQLPSIDLILFGLFLILAFLDEMNFQGILKIAADYRLFLKIGGLVMIIIGRWEYLLGILCFDISYETTNKILSQPNRSNLV